MKKTIYLSLLLILSLQVKGQVSDIRLNLTPTASYTWWDSQMFVKNGPMVGAKLGIGLGSSIELRGVYEQSVGLKSTLNSLSMPENLIGLFNAQDVDISRWGGEFKADIPTNSIVEPYLTLGTGVQKLKFNEIKQEQIYLTAGLGGKYIVSDRVTLNLAAKVHAFNLDPSSMLRLDDPAKNDFNDWIDENITSNRVMNWSLNLGLQFNLNGKNPKNYTAVERALNKQYNNGLLGLRFVFEPGGAFVNFDNSTNMRNTYLLGGALGVDFNDYVGLRGFYYRSSEDEKVTFDFDKMAMYGADFTGKLNVAQGIVPYITVGGGYMNVYDSYVGVNPLTATPSSGYFAKAGVGLSIPISRYFELFGAANLLYTTDVDPEDVGSTEDLKKHTMFNAGLKFNIGKKAQANRALGTYAEQRVSNKTMMYEQRAAELKKELDKAYALNDTQKITQIINEKQRLEAELIESIEAVQATNGTPMVSATNTMPESYAVAGDSTKTTSDLAAATTNSGDQTMIRLTPAELESLVDKVVQGVGAPVLKKETPEERLDRLERLILSGAPATRALQQQPATASLQREIPQEEVAESQSMSVTKSMDDSNRELMEEMRRISNRIEENSLKIDNAYRQQPSTGSDRTFIVSPGGSQTPFNAPQPQVRRGTGTTSSTMQDESQGLATSWVIYRGLSPFLAMNFGDATSVLFGVKANYGFSSTDFVFTPDLYFGVGGKVAYGLNANVTYPLLVNNTSMFNPYVGIGLGLNKIEKFNFGINFIAGSYVDVGNGSLFVEYTSRKAFKNNLFSLGYRFDF